MAKPSEPGTNTQAPPEQSTQAGPGGSALHPASPLPLPGGREKNLLPHQPPAPAWGGTPAESHPSTASPLPFPPAPSQALQLSFAKGTNLATPGGRARASVSHPRC